MKGPRNTNIDERQLIVLYSITRLFILRTSRTRRTDRDMTVEAPAAFPPSGPGSKEHVIKRLPSTHSNECLINAILRYRIVISQRDEIITGRT